MLGRSARGARLQADQRFRTNHDLLAAAAWCAELVFRDEKGNKRNQRQEEVPRTRIAAFKCAAVLCRCELSRRYCNACGGAHPGAAGAPASAASLLAPPTPAPPAAACRCASSSAPCGLLPAAPAHGSGCLSAWPCWPAQGPSASNASSASVVSSSLRSSASLSHNCGSSSCHGS